MPRRDVAARPVDRSWPYFVIHFASLSSTCGLAGLSSARRGEFRLEEAADMPVRSVFPPGPMIGNLEILAARGLPAVADDRATEAEMCAEIEASEPIADVRGRPEVQSDGDMRGALSSFVLRVVHELRNHLGTIRNTVSMVRVAGDDPATLAWSLGVLDRQAEQMSRLVEDMLDLALSGQGRLTLRRQQVDLGALLTGVVESVKATIEAPRHRLIVELPPLPLEVDADPARLRQVLTNLLMNSAKYTNPGGTIVVRAARQGPDVVLSVRDDGIGIEPEALPHVFDLFWQSSDAVDRAQGGHGVGLSLVREIVELHGGTVAAASDGRGKGSEFEIRLPGIVSSDGKAERSP
jgi:signal transduction histidine kinase